MLLMTSRARWAVLLIAGVFGVCLTGYLAACCSSPPKALGLKDGRLWPCPDSPNCVGSEDPKPDRRVEPLRYQGELSSARDRLRRALATLPRTRIVEDREDYLRAECTSAVFRFTDDLEARFDDAQKTIHLRSASRVGHSDLGANRERIERLRAAWAAAGS